MFHNVYMSLSLLPKMLQFRDCHVSIKGLASPSMHFFLIYLKIKRGSLVPIGTRGLCLTHSEKMGQIVEIVAKLLPFPTIEKVGAPSLRMEVAVPSVMSPFAIPTNIRHTITDLTNFFVV